MLKNKFVHKWKARNRRKSQCQIQIFDGVGIWLNKTIVIASDPIIIGSSVTNEAEVIATNILKELSINPAKLVFIEHNVKQGTFPASFDLVSFDWDSTELEMQNPIWNPLNRAEVEEIIGCQP